MALKPPKAVYLVVPLGVGDGAQGAAQVYVVETDKEDDAATAVMAQGFPRVAVVPAKRYEEA